MTETFENYGQRPAEADSRSDTPPARPLIPLPNYTLSTVCPGCGAPTFRLACKVRCPRCGFVWDCSEL